MTLKKKKRNMEMCVCIRACELGPTKAEEKELRSLEKALDVRDEFLNLRVIEVILNKKKYKVIF